MQHKKTFLAIAAAFILGASLNALAQGPGGGRGGQGRRPPAPAIDTALDANGDRVIDADEISGAPSALIGLDQDNDGELSFDECMGFSSGDDSRQAPPSDGGGSGGQPPAPPIFSALDTRGDQVIDDYEISDASSALLALDADGDGDLQADEYMPSHPGGGRGGGQSRGR